MSLNGPIFSWQKSCCSTCIVLAWFWCRREDIAHSTIGRLCIEPL